MKLEEGKLTVVWVFSFKYERFAIACTLAMPTTFNIMTLDAPTMRMMALGKTVKFVLLSVLVLSIMQTIYDKGRDVIRVFV
jgi:hypothetical protein